MQQQSPFVHRLRVRYAECDPQGIVFNANYVVYFDTVMTELWREAVGPWADFVESGTDMVVAEVGVRFLSPAVFDDDLAISAFLTRLGTTSITTRLEVRREGEDGVLAEGELRHVFVDPATKAKKPMPEELRPALQRFAIAAEPV